MIVLSLVITLFSFLFCVLIYFICGRKRNQKLKNSDENIAAEPDGATGVSNVGFNYDRYKLRVHAREEREERELENARNLLRNRILLDHNLPQLHHPVLIPPTVESDQYGSLDSIVLQDPTVSSSSVENPNVTSQLWNFFKNLSK